MEPQSTALPEWAYPAEDDVPETLLHLRIRTLLYELVRRYLAQQGVEALTGSEQFVYWVEGNPQRALAPDLYVVRDVPADYDVRSWQTWREGKVPDLAIEIVSDDVGKDYEIGPVRYAEAGVEELVIFDPLDGPGRIRWQVYVRDARGDLVRTLSTDADRVPCRVLGCHLRWVEGEDGLPRVRLGVGPEGETLVPSAEEAEAFERAEKDRERADKERERADKERERDLRLAAEAELEALRARLAHRDDTTD